MCASQDTFSSFKDNVGLKTLLQPCISETYFMVVRFINSKESLESQILLINSIRFRQWFTSTTGLHIRAKLIAIS